LKNSWNRRAIAGSNVTPRRVMVELLAAKLGTDLPPRRIEFSKHRVLLTGQEVVLLPVAAVAHRLDTITSSPVTPSRRLRCCGCALLGGRA
jgi:hypothetical protein